MRQLKDVEETRLQQNSASLFKLQNTDEIHIEIDVL